MVKKHLIASCIAVLSVLGCGRQGQDPREVNLFMGTSGDNGQVSPGAAAPFGMVYLCPDSDPAGHAGYDYSVDRISGISVNRIDGVGCTGAGGNLNVRPALPEADLRIVKGTEVAVPGYYSASLSNGVKVELATTGNVGAELYTFPEGETPVLYIDFSTAFSKGPDPVDHGHEITSDRTIQGYVRARNVCEKGWYKVYYHMDFSRPFSVSQHGGKDVTLEFDDNGRPVEVRIGLASLNQDDAEALVHEASSTSFREIRKNVERMWKEQLGVVSVKGGTADQRTLFNTLLYRSCLTPHDVTSRKGEYLGTDGQAHKAEGFTYYNSWSIWDTFRTKFPLFTLLYPSRMRDFCESMLRIYRTGKGNDATDFEGTPSVRTEHMTVVLLDAYAKGITGISLEEYYDDIKKEALGRIPQEVSADYTMETILDLWAVSKIAAIVGNDEDAKWFAEKGEAMFRDTWGREFMTIAPNYLIVEDEGLYEGTRWQYRWALPQYLHVMEEMHGKDILLDELKYFFLHDLYNQGNEPDIHVPFLFNDLGAPEYSQKIVRQLLTEDMTHRYGTHGEFQVPYFGKTFKNDPEGFIPEMDDDDGTMSAWYVFASMGLYPMIVGSEMYELTSPIFDEVSINFENGRKVKIVARGRRNPDDTIRRITWNGMEITDYQIAHSQLAQGGELVFEY
ncbi:MAG: GH92 family glycosyl hydrolase [Bacteroidales bacterium]|nr:GH92 family glycosyl hydrolase [Bacteroidales bacterium]